MEVLKVRGLSKRFGSHVALHEVDLTISRGEIVALLGQNGAGKTTFASIVAGILNHDRGTALCGGRPVTEREARDRIGYVPQEISLYPQLSTLENLHHFATLGAVKQPRRQIDELCERLHLDEHRTAEARTLSGGAQRRLHTAISLLGTPELLLFDEPTAGVDVRTRMAVLEYVKELAHRGSAICYTTHYLPEVEELDANVAVLHKGRIHARGEIHELVRKHGSGQINITFTGTAFVDFIAPDWVIDVDNNAVVIHLGRGGPSLGQVLKQFTPVVDSIVDVRSDGASLEQAFRSLTESSSQARQEAPATDTKSRSDA